MLSHRERKPIGAILRAIIIVSCGLFLLAAISAFWRRRASPAPSATVRKVILHQPDQHDGPVIYMDDGTVWVLSDAAERICITRGDRIRYVSEPNIPRQQNSASPDTCKLEDSSTGYVAEAVRLSAPFMHSSYPGN